MSRNQIATVVALVIVVLIIIGWAVVRRDGEGMTSLHAPSPTQQQTPPQPQKTPY
jgi:hypothetical protein